MSNPVIFSLLSLMSISSPYVNFGIVGKNALPPCSDRHLPIKNAIGRRFSGTRLRSYSENKNMEKSISRFFNSEICFRKYAHKKLFYPLFFFGYFLNLSALSRRIVDKPLGIGPAFAGHNSSIFAAPRLPNSRMTLEYPNSDHIHLRWGIDFDFDLKNSDFKNIHQPSTEQLMINESTANLVVCIFKRNEKTEPKRDDRERNFWCRGQPKQVM